MDKDVKELFKGLNNKKQMSVSGVVERWNGLPTFQEKVVILHKKKGNAMSVWEYVHAWAEKLDTWSRPIPGKVDISFDVIECADGGYRLWLLNDDSGDSVGGFFSDDRDALMKHADEMVEMLFPE